MSAAFDEALRTFPSAGAGVHAHLMTTANVAALAGIPPEEAAERIRQAMPRPPSPGNEIEATIRKAYSECDNPPADTWNPRPTPRDREAERRMKIKQAVDAINILAPQPMTFKQLRELNPIPLDLFCLDQHPGQAAALLMRTLYSPVERVYCGDTYGKRECIQTAERHAEGFLRGVPVPPLFILNPLTGEEGETKSGKPSFRADACISAHRFALYECDLPTVPLEVQAGFLAGRIAAGWPIVSITYSGGKSLHALLRVDCTDPEAWTRDVREELFPVLEKLGADKACRNPSRLTRLPGHYRVDKGKRQTLLWLALPESHTEPPQAQPEPDEVQTSASVFKPFTDADRAYLESVL